MVSEVVAVSYTEVIDSPLHFEWILVEMKHWRDNHTFAVDHVRVGPGSGGAKRR